MRYIKSNDNYDYDYDYHRYLKPIKCLFCELDEFRRLFEHEIAKYSMTNEGYDDESEYLEVIDFDYDDGIYFCGIGNDEVYDIIGNLLGVEVISIHTDHWDPTGVWIAYR